VSTSFYGRGAGFRRDCFGVGSIQSMKELTPQAFAKKWAEASLSERASYQQRFLDLCAMLGQSAPAEAQWLFLHVREGRRGDWRQGFRPGSRTLTLSWM
jgi:hypothetical protein